MSKQPGLISSLERFFFATETPFGLAIARILLPLAAGTPMLMRALRVREFYTTDGTPVQLSAINGLGDALPVLPPSIAIPLYGLMLCCLLTTSIGFKTRLSLFICTPLFVYFNLLDVVSTMTKYSVIASHLLMILAVSNCGSVWSVDAFLAKSKSGNALPPLFPVWPARLAQLLFAFVYFGAAITKVHTAEFFTGAQMQYWMLSNWNYDNPIGETMAMWTPLLQVSAYAAMVWELLFIVLVWRPFGRLPMIGLGIFFHLMTWITLGLYIFPAICLSGYFAFMTERDIIKIRQFLGRLRLRPAVSWPIRMSAAALNRIPRSVPSGVCWTCVVAIAAIGLVEIELQSDVYGLQAKEHGLPLTVMNPKVAQTMLQGEQRVREQDKYFNFDIGTFTIGGQLANRENDYEYGETILAQCNLNPPHEDMWVECLVVDDQNRTIEQFGQFVTREMMRANFFYRLGNKLIPGDYAIVLKSANQEISRREFALSGKPCVSTECVVTN